MEQGRWAAIKQRAIGQWEKLPAVPQVAAQFLFEILLPAPIVLLVQLFTRAQWSLAGFMSTYTAVGFSIAILLRIVKQHRQESGMRSMRQMLRKLDDATEALIGQATGGDSFPLLTFSMIGVDNVTVALTASGRFALQQVHGQLCGVRDRGSDSWGGPVLSHIPVIDFLLPNAPYRPLMTLQKGGEPIERFVALLHARNGFFLARMVVAWGDFPRVAVAVRKGNDPDKYVILEDFPGYTRADPESVFGFGARTVA